MKSGTFCFLAGVVGLPLCFYMWDVCEKDRQKR